MKANEYILDLIKDLVDNQVQFIVCGGVAIILQGVERMTMDLDLSLDMSKENLKRFLKVIKKNNLTPRAPVPAESILDEETVQTIVEEKHATVFTFIDSLNPFRQIDVFITRDKSYNAVLDDSEIIELDDRYQFRIASLEKLIEMKKEITPPRDKDLYDIARLREIRERKHGK